MLLSLPRCSLSPGYRLPARRSGGLASAPLPVQPTPALPRHPRPRSARLRLQAFKVKEHKWWEEHTAPNLFHVHGAKDLVQWLERADDRLVLVDFYTKWCVACRAFYPEIAKLAWKNPEMVVLSVDYDENKEMCQALGVKTIPFFHLYRKEGKVASFSIGVSKLWLLKDAIAKYKPKNIKDPFELPKEEAAEAAEQQQPAAASS